MLVSYWLAFVMVLVRVSAMVAFFPLPLGRLVPAVMKILLSLMVTLVVFPCVAPLVRVDARPVVFFLDVLSEVSFGAFVGFCVHVLVSAVASAGELAGWQMGLAFARIVDPESGGDQTVIATFAGLVGGMAFFGAGAHIWMLQAIASSFRRWPVGAFMAEQPLGAALGRLMGEGFLLMLQLAAPILFLMFVVTVVLGVMARLAPEVNVLLISFPLRIGVGLVGLLLFVPWLVGGAFRIMERVGETMDRLLVGTGW